MPTAEPQHKPLIPFRAEKPIRVRHVLIICSTVRLIIQVSLHVSLSGQNILFVTYSIRATCPVNHTLIYLLVPILLHGE